MKVLQDMDAACEGTVTTHLAEPLLAGDVSPISGAIHLAAAAPADFLPAGKFPAYGYFLLFFLLNRSQLPCFTSR